MQIKSPSIFTKNLLEWYHENARDLPWRHTQNPYKIWISEIILQQTRVAQGMEYYERFISHFPTLESLALAPEDLVLKLWQGLGYYSRARNLHKAAQQIVKLHKGIFPSEYKDLRSLSGIGEYTAGAILSFAFQKPYPAVDGNVLRVLSRITACALPIDSIKGKKELTQVASSLLQWGNVANINQALIELGALLCLPKNPKCNLCPISFSCSVFETADISLYPIKEKKVKITKRHLYFFIIRSPKWIIQKRDNKDIWRSLYQFPLLENKNALSQEEVLKEIRKIFSSFEIKVQTKNAIKHKLSHQELYIHFLEGEIKNGEALPPQYIEIDSHQLDQFAFPVPILRYLESRAYL